MNPEQYQAKLRIASKLRLQATSMLAESDENAFDAAVLLHNAERAIWEAQLLLETDDRTSQIRLEAERCWCLLDGFDPLGAERLRAHLLKQCVDDYTSQLVGLALGRLNSALDKKLREHRSLIKRSHLFVTAAREGRLPLDLRGLPLALSEIQLLVSKYPGTAGYWWANYRILDAMGDKSQAWKCLERAHKLDPVRGDVYRAIMVLSAPEVLPFEEARAYLGVIAGNLERQPVEVLLHYAFAELKLDRESRVSYFLERARRATDLGESRAEHPRWKSYFRVARRIIDARASGERLSAQILADEDLGDLIPPGAKVQSLPESKETVIDFAYDRREALPEVDLSLLIAQATVPELQARPRL